MISYLCGMVMAAGDRHIIVDVNGVGYRVSIPGKSVNSIAKIGSQVKLFTHYNLNPRDGTVELYGFQTPEELNFFELLTSVSGIGPKSAQAIISSADLQSLQIGIIKGDDEYLRKVSGMGPKTAQRLILELKTKVMASGAMATTELGPESEAMDALVTLGYSQYQARDAVRQVSEKAKTTEEKIREALKILGSKK